jgi:hypothetical protein
MSLEINRMLALSTAHLSPHTCNALLPKLEAEIPVWPKGEYGWFIYASLEIGALTEPLPADLQETILYAKAQGCDYLMFDRDWPETDQLRTYDWD